MNPQPVLPRLLVKTVDAAFMLQVSARKLADLTARGDIPVVRIDGSVRYAVVDLEAYVRGLSRGSVQAAGDSESTDLTKDQ